MVLLWQETREAKGEGGTFSVTGGGTGPRDGTRSGVWVGGRLSFRLLRVRVIDRMGVGGREKDRLKVG